MCSALLCVALGNANVLHAQCVTAAPNSTPLAGDGWGHGVAISADGTTAIVGGPGFDHSGSNGDTGAVRILVRAGETWQQQALLDVVNFSPFFAQSDSNFGYAVDISADGNTAIVGMPSDYQTLRVGSARVLVRNTLTQTWSQQARLLDPTPVNDGRFGDAVSISDDGNTVIVGQPGYSFEGIAPGAYVFTRTDTTWGRAVSLPASPAPGTDDEYGVSVAMSPDGLVAAVGAPARVNGAMSHGAVYVYRKIDTTWTLDEFITRTVTYLGYFGEEERFGHALSLYASGGNETLAIGDPDNSELLVPTPDDCPGTPPNVCRVVRAGCVFLYAGSGGAWALDNRVVAPEVQFPVDASNSNMDDGDRFGNAVSLRGGHLIVGAWGDEHGEDGLEISNNGSIYRFENGSMLQHVLHPVHFTNDSFGASVDISDDGDTMIAGAPRGDVPTQDFTGTAEIIDTNTVTQLFAVDPATSVFTITLTFPGDDPPPQTFTVHFSGRLNAKISLDCNGEPKAVAVQDYDALSSVETEFIVALPAGQSAIFGQVNLNTISAGHAARLNGNDTGLLRGYALAGKMQLLQGPSALAAQGDPCFGVDCDFLSCHCDLDDGQCKCDPISVLFEICILALYNYTANLAGDSPTLSVTNLDKSTAFDLGLGANNPTIHFTGGINVPLPCPADIAPPGGDNTVNVTDLLAVISAWGTCGDPDNCPADVNNDDTVNVTDLLAVISSWGPCP